MNRDKRFLAVLLFAFIFLGVFLHARALSVFPAGSSDTTTDQSASNMERAGLFPAFPVNVNTAGIGELMSVPGIGKRTAEALINRRISAGEFRSMEEVSKIIRHKLRFEKIRPLIAVTSARGSEKGKGLSNEG